MWKIGNICTDRAPTISEHGTDGNKKSVTHMQGENSFDVLNLSTNHIVLEQHLVEPLIDLPFLQDNTFVTRWFIFVKIIFSSYFLWQRGIVL